LTYQLQTEVSDYRRSLSSGPLLDRAHHQSWVQRFEQRLRGIYQAITCTRASDVDHRQAPQRPPRHSMQRQQPQRQEQQVPPQPRHQPRPRMTSHPSHRAPYPDHAGASTSQPSPRAPSPDQAGGSTWEQQYSPTTGYQLRPPPQPHGKNLVFTTINGTYYLLTFVLHPGYRPSMSAQQSSGSAWESEHDSGTIPQTRIELQNWLGVYNTPPPFPTQETQDDDEAGSLIPGRPVVPPTRLGWSSPDPNLVRPPRMTRRRP